MLEVMVQDFSDDEVEDEHHQEHAAGSMTAVVQICQSQATSSQVLSPLKTPRCHLPLR